jgi:hypothetical protein
MPRKPATEELLMITPALRAIMCGITRWATSQAELKTTFESMVPMGRLGTATPPAVILTGMP